MTSPSSTSPRPIAAQTRGDGVPVLVIHGIFGSGALFDTLSDTLAVRYRVIAPDMRGHGRNTDVPGSLTAEAVAEALIPTLDAAGVGAFHVVGHSHGGATAQVLARLLPDRVTSLTLVATYTFQPLMWWERLAGLLSPSLVRFGGTRLVSIATRLSRSSGGGRRMSAAAAHGVATQMAGNDREEMASAFAAARRFDSRHWLRDLRMPTLIIVGDADRIVAPRQSRLLEAGIAGSRLVTIPGAGHMLPFSHAELFGRMMLGWLDGIENATPVSTGEDTP